MDFPGFVAICAVQTQGNRLRNGQPVSQCQFFDRRRLQFHAASCRPVRLGQHQFDMVAGTDERIQCHCSKFRCAGKYCFHRFFP